jgi:hypothetical protein
MHTEITASFEVTAWDEHQFDRRAGAGKLTRAKVTKAYKGDIEGESVTEWLMAYSNDGSASFVGLERLRATIAGRQGTLVLQHVGDYKDGAAKADLAVIEGAGSDELSTTAGRGDFVADPAGRVRLELSFS